MKTTLPPRDWQALSDYLDGQLNPQERARLESRLKADAGLRIAFEELRRTKIILKNAPRMRAPRNFTLTTAMVARQAPQRSFWQPFSVLRLSSALATLLFILVFVGDYLSGGYRSVTVAFAPDLSAKRQASESAPAAEPFSDQVNQFAAPTEAATAELPVAKALQVPLTTGTPAATPSLDVSAPYPLPPSLAAGIAPSTTVTESQRIAELPTPTLEAPYPDNSLLEAYPPPLSTLGATAETEPPQPGAGAETSAANAATAPFWTFWRLIEASLAVLAVATGLAAFLLRRSPNP